MREAQLSFQAEILSVHDGDTMLVRDTSSSRNYRLRLFGIDAPEIEQSSGTAARDALRSLVANRTVSVRTTGDVTFGRHVGRIYLDGGLFVNRMMLEDGWAWHYDRYTSGEERALFNSLENEARSLRSGLWGEANPIRPECWRRGDRDGDCRADVVPHLATDLQPIPEATDKRSVAASQPEPVADHRTATSARTMSTLESVASLRNTRPVERSAYQKLLKASHDYAAEIAGADDRKFTGLATKALTEALAAQMGASPGQTTAQFQSRSLDGAQPSVWDDSVLQHNFRLLLQRAAQADQGFSPIVGPPSTFRIVGPGTRDAADNEFLDCVCIGRRLGTDQYCCTGTLVGKNVVVTAGHCFFCGGGGDPQRTVVCIGSRTSAPRKTYAGRIVRHPEYDQNGLHNDLSVIILDEDVVEALPRPIATTEEINRATFVRAVGFGNNDFGSTGGFGTKRLVDVPVASSSCSGPNDGSQFGCDPNLEMVAGFVGLGPDSCNGDSGGPVYVLVGQDARDPNAWKVAGATSRATDGATRPCGDGGIYVRLDAYLDFIRRIPGARF